MAVTNTPSTLVSRLKIVYPNGITSLVPDGAVLMKRIKFRQDLQPGEKARFDVQLDHELGFSVGQGEVTLNAAIAQNTARAEVEGYSIILRSRVSYDLITRAKSDKSAFAKFNDSKFIPMTDSFQKRQETLAMHGRVGLGSVSGNAAGVLTISPASWCPVIWLGTKGAVLEAFTPGGTQHNGDLTITGVDVVNKTVTVSGTSAAVVATDVLYFKGHRGVEPIGLMSIAKNTGTLYNIDASTNPLWAANAYDVGTSALTLAKILDASALAANKGCDEKLTCLVPVKAFQKLNAAETTLRHYDATYSKDSETGFESIKVHGASGIIELVPHMYSKEGEFVMFPERYTSLVGSSEMTNVLAKDGDIIFDLENSGAKEMRLFAEWTVFCEKPGYIVIGTRSDAQALHT